MPVDEETRQDVYEDFKRVHGSKRAGAIMAMLPPAGVPELATKADLEVLRAEMRTEMAEMRAELERSTKTMIKWMMGIVLPALLTGISASTVITAAIVG